ncbi:YolA family protein [Pseudomonas sp. 15FMM2]|uniref:YolA family protein n=1 Tax=Pseudomonas imrae TaxID=2992837 RepID=A0ACC7PCS7_9PSED
MKKAIAWSLAPFACISLWLGAAPAWGAPAPALSEVRVFKVESANCTEAIAEGADTTRMCVHRGPTRVYVMEVGIGNNSVASFDGARLAGQSTAVCQVGSISQACSGSGTLMGYVYMFELDVRAQGAFRYSNTSINAPHNMLQTVLSIR